MERRRGSAEIAAALFEEAGVDLYLQTIMNGKTVCISGV